MSGLEGISDETLEMHFKVYQGYVKETDRLSDQIATFLRDGMVDQEQMPAYSELKRRVGFESNGVLDVWEHTFLLDHKPRVSGQSTSMHSSPIWTGKLSRNGWDKQRAESSIEQLKLSLADSGTRSSAIGWQSANLKVKTLYE